MPRSTRKVVERHTILRCELLEDRRLLSLSPAGIEFNISSSDNSRVTGPRLAHDAAGDFVVVWESNLLNSVDVDIHARRVSAAGQPLGDEILVNSFTPGNQTEPVVAMDDAGDFVVAWTSAPAQGQTGQDGDGKGVYARRFNAAGTAQGDEFRVNTTTASDEHTPSVAMDAAGDFVVVWQTDAPRANPGPGQFPTTSQVYSQRYNAAGLAQGVETSLSETPNADQLAAQVVMDRGGNYIAIWAQVGWHSPTDVNAPVPPAIQGRRFALDGTPLTGQFDAFPNSAIIGLGYPTRAMIVLDSAENFAVGASHFDSSSGSSQLIVQRFGPSAVPQGPILHFNQAYNSDMALGLDGELTLLLENPGLGRGLQRFDATGSPRGSQAFAVDSSRYIQTPTAILDNGHGTLIAAWEDFIHSSHIQAQLFSDSIFAVANVFDPRGAGLPSDQALAEQFTSISVGFTVPADTTGGSSGATSVTNPANWQLFKNGADVSQQIASITYDSQRATLIFQSPLTQGSYRLVARSTMTDREAHALDGNNDGSPGGDFSASFTLGPFVGGPDVQVTGSSETFDVAKVLQDTNGNYTIVWEQHDQYFRGSVYGQRFDAAGQPVSNSFFLGRLPGNSDWGMDGQGNIIGVSMVSSGVGANSQSLYQIMGQRFDASGQPLGSAFRIDSFNGDQDSPIVAVNANGDFVVTWSSDKQDGSGWGAYARRYDKNGVAEGDPFQVNSIRSGDQFSYGVAIDANGGFVIAWSDDQATGTNSYMRTLFAKTYSPKGIAGREFKINTDDPSPYITQIVMQPSGNFAVFYATTANAGRSTEVDSLHGLLYSADGTPRGQSMLVNKHARGLWGRQVGVDAQGNFQLTWLDVTQSGNQVLTQRFLADGTLFASPELVTTDVTTGSSPIVALEGNGNAIVVWPSTEGLDPATSYQTLRGALHQVLLTGVLPPVVDLNGPADGIDFQANFVSGQGPVAIGDNASLLVLDGSATNLATAALQIGSASAGDVLAVNTAGTQISATYAHGVLQLAGTDTLAHYQQVLRSATFNTTASRSIGAAIDIAVSVNDASSTSSVAHSRLIVYQPGSARIVARDLFYNNSHFDGNDPAANASDDAAIGPDKQALLPGQTASLANVSSFYHGINGIMIDVAGAHGAITAGDFTFKAGALGDANQWALAAKPSIVTVRAGAGVNGSDRIEIIWPDDSICNEWLQVTMNANGATGLAAPDLFQLGSEISTNIGSGSGFTLIPLDILRGINRVLAAGGSTMAVGNADADDFNRDGKFSPLDLLIAINQLIGQNELVRPAPSELNVPIWGSLVTTQDLSASTYTSMPITSVSSAAASSTPSMDAAAVAVALVDWDAEESLTSRSKTKAG